MEQLIHSFEATLSQLETITEARAILPIGNSAHPGLKEVIGGLSHALRRQYDEHIKGRGQGISQTDHARILKLLGSLNDDPESREPLSLILKDEMPSMSEQRLTDAVLEALFPDGDTRNVGENQAAGQHRLFQAEEIFHQTMQRVIDGIKIFQDEGSVPRQLEAQINGPVAMENGSRFEELITAKLRSLTFYPIDRIVKLHYYITATGFVNIDVHMQNVNDAERLITRLQALNEDLRVMR